VVFGREENRSFMAVNAILAAGGKVGWSLEAFALGSRQYAAGTFVAESASLPAARLKEIAATTGVSMTAGVVTAKTGMLGPLKVGLYQSWQASMDEGWIRLIFDEFGLPYARITDADVKAGDLRSRFDVVVLPDQSPGAIVDGLAAGSVPERYAGGITAAGVVSLKRFVEDGGVLVCNGAASGLAIEHFSLPVTNAVRGLAPREFFIPGSILKMDYDPSHPLAYGMPKRSVAFFSRSQVFRVQPGVSGGPGPAVVAKYPNEPLLLSGWQQGESRIRGEAAIVSARVGAGRVVLFGFNVVNRYQTPAAIKLLLNAVYHGQAER